MTNGHGANRHAPASPGIVPNPARPPGCRPGRRASKIEVSSEDTVNVKQPRWMLLLASLVSVGSLVVFANPAVVITAPTSASSYTTTVPQLTLAGTAVGATGVTGVAWRCETCSPANGSATLESAAQSNWGFQIDRLRIGANTIVVTAESADGRTAVDEIVVTYAPSDRWSPIVTIATDGASDHRVTSGVAALSGICSDNVGCTEIDGRTAPAATAPAPARGSGAVLGWRFDPVSTNSQLPAAMPRATPARPRSRSSTTSRWPSQPPPWLLQP